MPKRQPTIHMSPEMLPSSTSPEYGLLSAILLRAILDIKTLGPKLIKISDRRGGKLDFLYTSPDFISARKWLDSKSNHEFSLNWICSHLGISRTKVRQLAYNSNFIPPRIKS